MTTNVNEAFSIVAERLISSGYKRIQYFPTNRARYFGHELLLLRSFLLKDNVTLFRASALLGVYEKLMRKIDQKLYMLYNFFFQCKELPLTGLLQFFDQNEINILIRNNIISCTDSRLVCNYRFVPIDKFLTISSPPCEFDTVNYVHIGGDTIKLWNLIKKECKESINNAIEIGCGAGFLSLWISQFAQHVTATDISQRTLEFAKFNAEINGIGNIVTRNSDVYSNVEGKFDLIISNPPYLFLPEGYSSRRSYSYGGYLGTDILKKIFLGFDRHLKENGTALLLANAYIKDNGTNTLYDTIKNLFHGKPYSITLKQLFYQRKNDLFAFYKKHNISHSILYFIKIQKAQTYKLSHISILGVSKVAEKMKIKLF
jgi:SAM-dependent methyltransferase